MPENLQGSRVEHEASKIVGYPINLQSLLQTLVLVVSLIGGVVYADRRITILEQEFKHQSEFMKEMRDDQRRSLENQRDMKEKLNERRK